MKLKFFASIVILGTCFSGFRLAKAEVAIPEPFEGSALPNKDFTFHAGPVIGTTTNDKNSELDNLLGGGLTSAGIHLMAWTTLGYNVSNAQDSNAPMGYTIYPNELDLTEGIFRIVKEVDTVQKDHFDWGFKVDFLYGVDYYMFLSKGLWSSQLSANNGSQNKYGYDIPQFYVDFYTPGVAKGLNFRVGRILTNPTVYMGRGMFFTHTVFDNNIGDTETGVVASLKTSDSWTYQLGLTNTPDVALLEKGDSKATVYAATQWTSTERNDSVLLEAYGVNNGQYAYHNWQTFYAIWTHKFSQDLESRLQTAYYYEKNVPVSNVPGQGFIPVGTLSNPNATSGLAQGYSFVESVMYSLNASTFVGARAEYSADPQGTLTGTAANYLTGTLELGHNFSKWLTGTAEMRRDYSFINPAYDNGNTRNLYLFAASLTARL